MRRAHGDACCIYRGRVATLVEAVPQLIRQGRAEAAITQQVLAERLGVDQSTVSRWERGKELPSLRQADLVFQELGLVVQLDRRRPPRPDDGVDRAQIQRRLRMSPEERLDANAAFLRFAQEARRG